MVFTETNRQRWQYVTPPEQEFIINCIFKDIDNVYEAQYAYLKTDPAEHTAVTLQFYRRPGDIELKFKKKDQFYLALKGLDQVNFGSKDRDFCLEKVLPASKGRASNDLFL